MYNLSFLESVLFQNYSFGKAKDVCVMNDTAYRVTNSYGISVVPLIPRHALYTSAFGAIEGELNNTVALRFCFILSTCPPPL